MPILLFELNEVPFKVLDAYCREKPGSALAALMGSSVQFISECDDTVELDPWISWPTLHRGVNDEKHQILHLGQILDKADRQWPPIWQIIANAGYRVGVFGSVHSGQLPSNVSNYSFYVPDFFDDEVFARPAYLEPFQRFNLGMTRRSARNVDTKVPTDLILQFVRSAPRLGLKADTIASVAKQVISERREPRVRIRRRSLQSLMMADVYLSLLRRERPDFSTFYTNHVAAAMHRYWAATFPGDYSEQSLSDEWIDDYRPEIFEAMTVLDRIIVKVKKYCDETNTQLVLATSMGQAAVAHSETHQFATITEVEALMSALGFEPGAYRKRHAMVPCGGVVLEDPARVVELAAKLDQITVDGVHFVNSENEVTPLSYGLHDGHFVSLFSYFENYGGPHEVKIGNRILGFEEAGFGITAHEDGVSVTAHHIKEGMVLIYDPETPDGDASRKTVSTTEIAPAILERLGIAPPAYMSQPSHLISDALFRPMTHH